MVEGKPSCDERSTAASRSGGHLVPIPSERKHDKMHSMDAKEPLNDDLQTDRCVDPKGVTVSLDGAFDQLFGDSCQADAGGSRLDEEGFTCDLDVRLRIYEDEVFGLDQGTADIQEEFPSGTPTDQHAVLDIAETVPTLAVIANLRPGQNLKVAL